MRLHIMLTTLVASGAAGLALAGKYECEYTDKQTQQRVKKAVEASSREEALYKTSAQAVPGKSKSENSHQCRSAAEAADVFLSDGRFKNNSHLRPYLPPDVKMAGNKYFMCTATGDFLPDNSPDSVKGKCMEVVSQSLSSTWLVRFTCQAYMSEVWKKMEGGGLKPWAAFGNCKAPTPSISPEARRFAAARNPQVQGAAPSSANSQEQPASPIDAGVKKALDDVLKAFK